jgi:hypothetical protein
MTPLQQEPGKWGTVQANEAVDIDALIEDQDADDAAETLKAKARDLRALIPANPASAGALARAAAHLKRVARRIERGIIP